MDKLCYLALTDDKVGMNRSDFARSRLQSRSQRRGTLTDQRQRHRHEQARSWKTIWA